RTVLRQRRSRGGRLRQLSRVHALRVPEQSRGALQRREPRLPRRPEPVGSGAMIGRGTTCTAALALAGVMLATGCGRPAPEPWPHETDVSDHELPAGDPILDDASIFDLDIPLVDQHGDRWRLGDLGGRPMIAAMIYTSCTAVCLRITDEL